MGRVYFTILSSFFLACGAHDGCAAGQTYTTIQAAVTVASLGVMEG